MPQTLPLALAVAEKAMREFCNQWLSGLQPILSLETASNGQIRVLSKVVVAGDVTRQHDDDQGRCGAGKVQQHRRRSPAYRRRLLRRAAARAAADATEMDRSKAEKFVQTDADKCCQLVQSLDHLPPHPDPVIPCMHAAEAEQLPQHHPQYLPIDEVCSDQTYAESSPLPSQALPQLDGHADSHILDRSEINFGDFIDVIQNQEEERRRDSEESRREREADLKNFRKLMHKSFL